MPVVGSRNQNPYQVYSIVHQDTEPEPDVTLGQYDYSYDAVGNRTAMNYTLDGSQTNVAYNYDNAYRLIEESYNFIGNGQSSTEYRYDRAGNRKLMISDDGTTSYLYDANDQLTNVIKPDYYYEEYEYDARGNLTQVHSYGHGVGAYAHYDYNARDLLVSYGTSSDDTNVTNVALMDYDHRGNRIEMTASSTLNTYLWDEFSRFGDVVLESSLMGSRSYTLAGVSWLLCPSAHKNSTQPADNHYEARSKWEGLLYLTKNGSMFAPILLVCGLRVAKWC